MLAKKVMVRNEHGLHARVALRVAQKSMASACKITLCNGCKCADGCSVLEMLMLGAGEGAEIELTATGGNEEECLREIAAIFTDGAGI